MTSNVGKLSTANAQQQHTFNIPVGCRYSKVFSNLYSLKFLKELSFVEGATESLCFRVNRE